VKQAGWRARSAETTWAGVAANGGQYVPIFGTVKPGLIYQLLAGAEDQVRQLWIIGIQTGLTRGNQVVIRKNLPPCDTRPPRSPHLWYLSPSGLREATADWNYAGKVTYPGHRDWR
jgi:hypothetical protein